MLKLNRPADLVNPIGMPNLHAAAFRDVAMLEKCVIIVRATGPTCRGLLEEGYDTKGYRIHGKSCDWGPMAGIVLRDPRLNKAGLGKEEYNRKQHKESIDDDHEGQGWKASTTPLKISDARRLWLVKEGKIQVNQRGPDRWEGQAKHPTGIVFDYSLIRDAQNNNLWGVYFDTTKNNARGISGGFRQERGSATVRYDTKYGAMYEPMLAVTNPPDHRSWPEGDYRNAVTGDYDLFAVWPFVKSHVVKSHDYYLQTANTLKNPKFKNTDVEIGGYDARTYGKDYRPLGTVMGSATKENEARAEHLERHFANKIVPCELKTKRNLSVPVPSKELNNDYQGTKLGNITERIYMVGQLINSNVGHRTGFPNRNVVWHSDEAARPFVNDVDLPVMAFTPAGNSVFIETIIDFKVVIRYCKAAGIKVSLSNAWAQAPTKEFPNRLGEAFAGDVPPDGVRRIVPFWYND